MDRREAQFPRSAFPFRGCRGIAQAGAAAASAGVDGGKLGRGDRLGRRPRLLDPDGPALIGPRNRRQAPALCGKTSCCGVLRDRPRHPDRPPGGNRRQCRQGSGGSAQWRRMDRQFLSRRATPAGHAGEFHASGCRPDPALSRRGDSAWHAGQGRRRDPAAARGDRSRLSLMRAAEPPILSCC